MKKLLKEAQEEMSNGQLMTTVLEDYGNQGMILLNSRLLMMNNAEELQSLDKQEMQNLNLIVLIAKSSF